MSDADSSLTNLVGASVMTAFFDLGPMSNADSSFDYMVGAPIVAADFDSGSHICSMSDAETSLY